MRGVALQKEVHREVLGSSRLLELALSPEYSLNHVIPQPRGPGRRAEEVTRGGECLLKVLLPSANAEAAMSKIFPPVDSAFRTQRHGLCVRKLASKAKILQLAQEAS